MKTGYTILRERGDIMPLDGHTYTSLAKNEKLDFKKTLLDEGSRDIAASLNRNDQQIIDRFMKNPELSEDDVRGGARPVHIREHEWIDILKSLFSLFTRMGRGRNHENNKEEEMLATKKTRSAFGFGKRFPRVECDLECFMRFIYAVDIKDEPELFRRSASYKEVESMMGELRNLIKNLSLVETDEEERASPDGSDDHRRKMGLNELEEDNPRFHAIVEKIEDFGCIEVASGLKHLLRSKPPLFPSKYIYLYLKLQEESEERLLMFSRFITIFLLSTQERDKLEAVCGFFHTLIARDNSQLKYQNISIVMVPAFFMDKSFPYDGDYKEKINALQRLLEFFLRNGKKIFIVKETDA